VGGRNARARAGGGTAETEKIAKEDYPTPPEFLSLVREVIPEIVLDPASNPRSVVGATITIFLPKWQESLGITAEEAEALGIVFGDGLVIPWGDVDTFGNPPYGLGYNKRWARKIANEGQSRECSRIVLVPSAPGCKWWRPYRPRKYGGESDACCLLEGRLRFLGAKDVADFESAVIYFGPHPERFHRVFAPKGWTT
jgi:hypothetical protein